MDLEKARIELQKAVESQNFPEVARIIGEPVDPREPVNDVINLVCDVEPNASPDEYLYYFEADEDAKIVYTFSNSGTVTAIDVTLNTPNAITFLSRVSPLKRINYVDLNNAKFDVISKKKLAITRAMDNEEVYRVLSLFWAGAPVANRFSLDSGKTYLDYPKLVDMIQAVKPYGSDLVLVCGSTVYVDLITTDYNENKNQSVIAMVEKLGIKLEEVTGTVSIDTVSGETSILDPNSAILVATKTATGKPAHFQRKSLVQNGILNENNEPKARKLTVVPVIPKAGEAPHVGLWGYGEYQASLENPKAVARFSRT